MLTVRDIVITFPSSLAFRLIKLLVKEGIIDTILSQVDLQLLSLSDDEFIEKYPLRDVFQRIKTEDVTKLSLLYYLHNSSDDEVKTYFIHNSKSYTILYGVEVPSDIWYDIMNFTANRKDMVSLSSVSHTAYTSSIVYKKQHQWSLQKQQEGLMYYRNHFLTQFQLEVLNNLVKGEVKIYVPNNYNFLLCTLIYSHELVKEGKRIMIKFDLDGFGGDEVYDYYKDLINDLVLDIFGKKLSIVGFDDETKPINFTSLTLSDTLNLSPGNVDHLIYGPYLLPSFVKNSTVNFLIDLKNVSDTFSQSEQTAVIVETVQENDFDEDDYLKGKTLTLNIGSDEDSLEESYFSFISSRSLREYDNIVVKVKEELEETHPFTSLYSLLSETSTKVKKLCLVSNKGYTEIPLPFKMVKQTSKDFRFSARLDPLVFDITPCGLSYADCMMLYYHSFPERLIEDENVKESYLGANNWLKKHSENSSLKLSKSLIEKKTEDEEGCWLLVDPNADIEDKIQTIW